MFVVYPPELSTNFSFTPSQTQEARIRDLQDRLETVIASRNEYKSASLDLSRQLAECMAGHKRLHQEKQALFNEVCELRHALGSTKRSSSLIRRSLEDPVSEEAVVFRLKPHAYQSQKLQNALRETWPQIEIPPVSEKDLMITCTVLDFVRFLIARDSCGAQNSWKDLNVRFQRPRKKEGPSYRIDLT